MISYNAYPGLPGPRVLVNKCDKKAPYERKEAEDKVDHLVFTGPVHQITGNNL